MLCPHTKFLTPSVYSTRTDIRGVTLAPSQAFKAAAARWYVWAALSYFIVLVDRHLPIRNDALWKRFLVHIPISWVFIAAYTYLNYWACVLLDAPIDTSVSSAEGTFDLLSTAASSSFLVQLAQRDFCVRRNGSGCRLLYVGAGLGSPENVTPPP